MDKNLYLQSSEIIDWETPSVFNKAKELASNSADELEIAKRCFELVRDEIFHCMAIKLKLYH